MEAGRGTGWVTSSANYGLCHYHPGVLRTTAEEPSAGLSRAENAYHDNAHAFPRFERQKIRAMLDENLITGAKQPDPELLKRVPNARTGADLPPGTGSSVHSGAYSVRSGKSNRSKRSVGSTRSGAASAAGSMISQASVASSRWLRQADGTDFHLPWKTTSANYGKDHEAHIPHGGRGREVWMLGRGGGQISSYDNSLVDKGHHVPLIRS
eukprot:gnl/MRDRNA2_/MRDRNA2_96328_c0_seq1.p1 gnl/MRDRNA2_/MRDRNA2_96328_c0~~gnl/MRDRNA2_/MRDRNA2_96328_c0_seq1.p1  ORF type:complete len:210 (-),score=24.59 gnl/MRDRNA2_/MRDRNA2_96328_c0_seq1:72-701(-)